MKRRAMNRSTMVIISLHKYKKINLLIDKHDEGKKIMSIVFPKGNIYTTQLPASTTPDTDHITSTAHNALSCDGQV
jgi:hypothetical protein